jgi:FlaA1/EpsC-like NDP-sugar epimerase
MNVSSQRVSRRLRVASALTAASRRLNASSTARTVRAVALQHRRTIVVAIHAAAVAVAGYVAFWLRFDGDVPERERQLFVEMLPWLLAIRGLTFVPFRLYEGLWRYTGIYDLRNLLAGVGMSSLLYYVLVHWGFGYFEYPRSVFVIDAMLLIFFMGGLRLTRRVLKEVSRLPPERRVLIYGAGDAGEMVVRDMKRFDEYQPIGFIDDNRNKVGQRIHGFPVLGTRLDLPRIVAEERPDEVLVAIPRADVRTMREIVGALEPYKLPITTVPHLRDLLNGQVEVSQIRPLSIGDLLPRAPVGLAVEPLARLITGKRVMVTGAGGSIGSELCRQIADLCPELLVLYERHENSLYMIESQLRDRETLPPVRAVIGDVTDVVHLDVVLADTRPHIIFHAAAHKHVPMMEFNPCEAVKNNVSGTRMVAEAAIRHGVDRFVLISTDKAVNPSSVMGATKRVAELTVQAATREAPTACVTVRFGNVLGSNGSVVLRFLDQIKSGGPVTVTHPEMRRYFMLIPEAVQLVLHAAALGEPGALYTLQMGDQLKLVDMARNLIRLSGYVPEDEIPIEFVGLRPGEKLSEELVASDETLSPSPVEQILRVRAITEVDVPALKANLAQLERYATVDDTTKAFALLTRIVPTFTSNAGAAAALAGRSILPHQHRARVLALGPRRRPVSPPDLGFGNRRGGTPDRRQKRRGGRRLTDLIGLHASDRMLAASLDSQRETGAADAPPRTVAGAAQ